MVDGYIWGVEVVGSNPVTPILIFATTLVEAGFLHTEIVIGSNPVVATAEE